LIKLAVNIDQALVVVTVELPLSITLVALINSQPHLDNCPLNKHAVSAERLGLNSTHPEPTDPTFNYI
jgi:hypothetical protein